MNVSRSRRKYLFIAIVATVIVGCILFKPRAQDSSNTSDTVIDEPYELVMTVISNRGLPDIELVQNEVNKIAIEKLGVKVKLLPVTRSEIPQKYALMLASNEKIDLMILFGNTVGEFASRNQVLQLDELVQKYGADIIAAEGIAMSGGYFAGKLYGVPSEQKMGRSYGIVARTDLIEKYSFDLAGIKTYKDLEPVFQEILDNEPDMIPLESNAEMFRFFHEIDMLGSSLASGCLLNGGLDNTKIVNLFSLPIYKEFVDCMYRWNEKGFFPENPDTLSIFKSDLVLDGSAFSYMQSTELEMAAAASATVNHSMTAIQLTRDYATTSMYQVTRWAIPKISENPEKAMEFLNLTYADERVVNLLSNGIEGVHYEKTEHPKIIRRPYGVNTLNTGYDMLAGYFGDKSLKYVWEPIDHDIFKQLEDFNQNVLRFGASKALGYVFDPTPKKTEMYMVEQVINEYQKILETGCVDPDVFLPLFISELESAGINDVIAENQRQLDFWLADK